MLCGSKSITYTEKEIFRVDRRNFIKTGCKTTTGSVGTLHEEMKRRLHGGSGAKAGQVETRTGAKLAGWFGSNEPDPSLSRNGF